MYNGEISETGAASGAVVFILLMIVFTYLW